MKETNLNSIHIRKIYGRIDKANSRFKWAGGFLLFFAAIGLFIPLGWSPRSRGLSDPSATFVESSGFMAMFVVLFIFALLFFWAVVSHTKYFSLRKDTQEAKGYIFRAKVERLKVMKGDGEKEIEVYLEPNESKRRKLVYLISEFPGIHEGDELEVTMTKHAKYVVDTKKLKSNPGQNFRINVL